MNRATKWALIISCSLWMIVGCSQKSTIAGALGDAFSSSSSGSNSSPGDPAPAPASSPIPTCGNLIPALPTTNGPIIHVAVSGDDTLGSGSNNSPYATLGRALQGVTPGTRIQIGSGTYAISTVTTYSNINGTPSQPIVITAEPAAIPVFDVSAVSNAAYFNQPMIAFNNSSYVVLDSIQIVGRAYPPASMFNSSGVYIGSKAYSGGGLGFSNSNNMTLTRSVIHQIPAEAMVIIGNNVVVAGNSFYDVVLGNTNNKASTAFNATAPSAVIEWYQTDSSGHYTGLNENISYLQNTLRNSWGEGLNCLFVNGCKMIQNIVYNTFSVHLYLDHATDVQVLRNIIYDVPGTSEASGGAGISFDDEASYGSSDSSGHIPFVPQQNILIANNEVGPFGRSNAIGFFHYDTSCTTYPGNCTAGPQNYWSNLQVVNNIFNGHEIWIDSVKGPTKPFGGLMQGNIFINTPSINLLDTFAWNFQYNDVVGTTSYGGHMPNVFTGNFSVKPNFIGPTNTLAGYDTTNAASLQVPYNSQVPQDALCNPRSTTTTTAGVIGP